MKFIISIITLFISSSIYGNESNNDDVEVINLYQIKSLDQMVLENINEEIQINDQEQVNIVEEINDLDQDNQNLEEVDETTTNDEVEVKQIGISKDNFLFEKDISELNNYFDNLMNINSKTLQDQIILFLQNIELNLEREKDKEILFTIVHYFKSVGQINKSYDLIEKYQQNIDQNFEYFLSIKINYLLSTSQLNEACDLKNEINKNIKLEHYLLEKLDIFCLILNDNKLEANLLNSILIETESELDNYFQLLHSFITEPSEQLKNDITNYTSIINSDLVFLYSAMIRIAELPFTHEFYQLDKKNLAIPIILNQSSAVDLRIKAANESFLANVISIESLSALYMSVDFNSDQFNNSEKTIELFSNNEELSMAYLFQLVNIQIFPSDRIKVLIKFWDFAKQNNLEEIAYKLSQNMLKSIEFSAENIVYAPEISSAYIFNRDFENAIKWIELYEATNQNDSKSTYIRIMLDLYSSDSIDSFINSINSTLTNHTDYQSKENEELLFVMHNVMNLDFKFENNVAFGNIFDERPMLSIFLYDEIKRSIVQGDNDKFLILSSISLNKKNWDTIHPEHLSLLLNGFLKYNDGLLFRNLILEIFRSYKFLI